MIPHVVVGPVESSALQHKWKVSKGRYLSEEKVQKTKVVCDRHIGRLAEWKAKEETNKDAIQE